MVLFHQLLGRLAGNGQGSHRRPDLRAHLRAHRRAVAVVALAALALARRSSYVEFFRGTPALVQLFVIYFGLPDVGFQPSPFQAAIVGLGLNGAAYMSEVYRAGIESIHRGQMEAALSLGMTPARAMRYIILPQAMRTMLPPITNFAIVLLKDTSIVFAVGVVEIMALARNLVTETLQSARRLSDGRRDLSLRDHTDGAARSTSRTRSARPGSERKGMACCSFPKSMPRTSIAGCRNCSTMPGSRFTIACACHSCSASRSACSSHSCGHRATSSCALSPASTSRSRAACRSLSCFTSSISCRRSFARATGDGSRLHFGAVIGLGLHGGAILAEVFRSGIEALHKGQREAAIVLGMTPAKSMIYIILPQALRVVLPPVDELCDRACSRIRRFAR